MRTYVRSYTLPANVAVAIQKVATRLGISQSSLVAQLVGTPVLDLESTLEDLPTSPTQSDVVAVAARSRAVVEQRLEEYRAQVDRFAAEATDESH